MSILILDKQYEEYLQQKEEIERLNKELEVAKTNEETYRLEMLDITKRLGLDEETLFDDVKDKAERLNNIIKEVREKIKKHLEAKKYLNDLYTDKQILEFVLEKTGGIDE